MPIVYYILNKKYTMRLIQTLSSCLCTGIIALFTACSQAPQSPIDSVDPFIGTGFHGHTYPGATAPYGAVQLSPDTRKGNWDACSGYHYSDSTLMGFSHTHLSGTGCIDRRYPIPPVSPDTFSVLALGREGFPGLLLGESQGGRCISGTYHDPACRDTPIYL